MSIEAAALAVNTAYEIHFPGIAVPNVIPADPATSTA